MLHNSAYSAYIAQMTDWKMKKECSRCDGQGFVVVTDPAALRRTRVLARISLRQMADRLQISAPYLSDIERGNREVPDFVEAAYRKLK